jgi:hypothetical protein
MCCRSSSSPSVLRSVVEPGMSGRGDLPEAELGLARTVAEVSLTEPETGTGVLAHACSVKES